VTSTAEEGKRRPSRAGKDPMDRALHRPLSRFSSLPRRRARAFTLLEFAIALAILAILASIAMPAYQDYRERIRVAQAVTEIGAIQSAIQRYIDDNRIPPDDLAEVGQDGKLDPWRNPYQYLNLVTLKGKGTARKNRNLVPINSDYDLYSMGKDGASVGPLTAKESRDDIVRANDGRFIGLAKDYDP
jgi:general secretion pathway protein G